MLRTPPAAVLALLLAAPLASAQQKSPRGDETAPDFYFDTDDTLAPQERAGATRRGREGDTPNFVQLKYLHVGLSFHSGDAANSGILAGTLVGDFGVSFGKAFFLQFLYGLASSRISSSSRTLSGSPALLAHYEFQYDDFTWAIFGGVAAPVANASTGADATTYVTAVGQDITRAFIWAPNILGVGAGLRASYAFRSKTVLYGSVLPGIGYNVKTNASPDVFIFHTLGVNQTFIGPFEGSLAGHGYWVKDNFYEFATELGLALNFGAHRIGVRGSVPLLTPFGLGLGSEDPTAKVWGALLDYTLIPGLVH